MVPVAAISQRPAASLDLLAQEVITPGLCVACGACVGICPHLIFYDGQVAAPDPCGLKSGRCYDLCPQTLSPAQDEKRKKLHKANKTAYSPPVGPVSESWQGRALDQEISACAQYGGVVSALTALALELGLAKEAVLTTRGSHGAPQGIRAKSRAEVLASAGSIYSAAGTLSALNQALHEDENHPLMLVGLPCQALAAASMKAHPDYPQAAARLGLVIGLFCTWNLPARGLRALLSDKDIRGPVKKFDVPPPPAQEFQVIGEQGEVRIPLDEVRAATLPGCALCPDMTAELADISVGAVEGRPGWNTILVRTDRGAELMEEARRKNLLALEPTKDASMDHLRQAAQAKRQRALKAQTERASG